MQEVDETFCLLPTEFQPTYRHQKTKKTKKTKKKDILEEKNNDDENLIIFSRMSQKKTKKKPTDKNHFHVVVGASNLIYNIIDETRSSN